MTDEISKSENTSVDRKDVGEAEEKDRAWEEGDVIYERKARKVREEKKRSGKERKNKDIKTLCPMLKGYRLTP